MVISGVKKSEVSSSGEEEGEQDTSSMFHLKEEFQSNKVVEVMETTKFKLKHERPF